MRFKKTVEGVLKFDCMHCDHVSTREFSRQYYLEEGEVVDLVTRIQRGAAMWPENGVCQNCGELNQTRLVTKLRWHEQWPIFFFVAINAVLAALLLGTTRQSLYILVSVCGFLSVFGYALWLSAIAQKLPFAPASLRDSFERPWIPSRAPIYALLGIVSMLFIVPLSVRALSDARFNELCLPAICHPGDKVRVFVPSWIYALEGEWGADARLELLNQHDFDEPMEFDLKTRPRRELGRVLEDKREFIAPYVDLSIPDRPQLEGASLHFHVELDLQYAVSAGAREYDLEDAFLQRDVIVHLSSKADAEQDRLVHLSSALAIMAMLFAALCWSLYRAWRLKLFIKRPGVKIVSESNE